MITKLSHYCVNGAKHRACNGCFMDDTVIDKNGIIINDLCPLIPRRTDKLDEEIFNNLKEYYRDYYRDMLINKIIDE